MKPSQLYRLQDLQEKIKGVETMIQLHIDDPSDVMLNQYKTTKEHLIGRFIDQFVSPAL